MIQTSGSSDPQWPFLGGVNFAVNPISGDQIVISSTAGRLFRTLDRGEHWYVIGDPNSLGNSQSMAQAFGAPALDAPAGSLGDYILVGNNAGQIFVTYTGGGGTGNQWTNISNGLTGGAVKSIVTNPTRGSYEAYAVTNGGVFHTSDTRTGTWTSVTGNLFNVTINPFGNAQLGNTQLMGGLTAIVADWRYVIPNNFANPSAGTHPLLYVAGDGGVVYSLDNGTTWARFPQVTGGNNYSLPTTPTPPGDGGGLPTVHVSDLDISIGNINPTTGRAFVDPTNPNDDPLNILVATTYGNSTYAIRLAPIVFPNSATQTPIGFDTTRPVEPPPLQSGSDTGNTAPYYTDLTTRLTQPWIQGYSQQTAFGTTVTVNLLDLTPLTTGGPLRDPLSAPVIGTGTTDGNGHFSVQVNPGYFKSDGSTDGYKTIGIQAVDQSGAKGNVALFNFTLDTIPPVVAAGSFILDTAYDTGIKDNYPTYTTSTTATGGVLGFDVTGLEQNAKLALFRSAGVNLTVDATTATDVSPVADGFTPQKPQDIGKTILITSSTGSWKPGVYTIVDVVNGKWRLDRAPASAGESTPASWSQAVPGATFKLKSTGATLNALDIGAVQPTDTVLATDPTAPQPTTVTTYVYSLVETDKAANDSVASPVTVIVDNTIPQALSTLTLNVSSDSGIVGSDDYTKNTSLTFDVTGLTINSPLAGNSYELDLFRDGTRVATLAYNSQTSGSVQIIDPGPVSFGQHSYTVQQVSLAGAKGPMSPQTGTPPATTPLEVYVRPPANAPAAPASPVLKGASDSGIAQTDDYTNTTAGLQFTVGGIESTTKTVNGASLSDVGFVTLYRRQWQGSAWSSWTSVATTSSPPPQAEYSTGTVNLTDTDSLTTPLALGTYQYYAVQTDRAGNASPGTSGVGNTTPGQAPPTGVLEVHVRPSANAPAAPASPVLKGASDSGIVATDDYTNTTNGLQFTVSGIESTTTPINGQQWSDVGFVTLYRRQWQGSAWSNWTSVATTSSPPPQAEYSTGTVNLTDSTGPLALGTYQYFAVQTDRAGDPSPGTATVPSTTPGQAPPTGVLEVHVRPPANAPAAPATPVLGSASDSGIAQTDDYTNVANGLHFTVGGIETTTTPLNGGSLSDVGFVTLWRRQWQGSAWSSWTSVATTSSPPPQAEYSTGTVNLTDSTGPLALGTYQYYAVQTDRAGNASTGTGTVANTTPGQAPSAGVLEVYVDTSNPAMPAKPVLVQDLGIIGNDSYTNVTTGLQFTVGGIESSPVGLNGQQLSSNGDVVLYRRQWNAGTSTWSAWAPASTTATPPPAQSPAGTVTLTDTGTLATGTYQYYAVQIDRAGNLGPAAPTSTTAPGTPPAGVLEVIVISGTTNLPTAPARPVLEAQNDSGLSNGDDYTRVNANLHFDISGIDTSTVVINGQVLSANGDVLLYRSQLQANGSWSTPVPVPQTYTPPPVQSPAGTVTLVDAGTLADGTYQYYAVQEDRAGNFSPSSPVLQVVIDTAAPAVPNLPALDANSDTGISQTDAYTAQNQNLQLDVSGIESGTVTINGQNLSFNGEVQLWRSQYNPATGTWSSAVMVADRFAPPQAPAGTVALVDPGLLQANGSYLPLPDGKYQYTAIQIDRASNASTASAALTVVVDTTAPAAAPVVPNRPVLEAQNDSGVLSTDSYTSANRNLSIDVSGIETGTVAMNGQNLSFNGDVQLYRSQLQANGTWSAPVPVPQTFPLPPTQAPAGTVTLVDPGTLADGTYQYTAIQIDRAGNASPMGPPLQVVVDTTAPAAPSKPVLEAQDNTAYNAGIFYTNKAGNLHFDISGIELGTVTINNQTLSLNGQVELLRNGVVVATATLSPQALSGTVTLIDPGPLVNGTYTYTAIQIDRAGNPSLASASQTVVVDTTSQAPLPPPLAELPTPTQAGAPVNISNNGNNDSAPTIVVNPNNPQQLVAVWTTNGDFGDNKFQGQGAYSVNGGATWTTGFWNRPSFGDPNNSGKAYLELGVDPTVAFDRNNNLYIASRVSSGDLRSGAIVLQKFTMSAGGPQQIGGNKVLYDWNGGSTEAAQNVTIAVDNNVANFVDPSTGAVNSDPFSGDVYVAWASVSLVGQPGGDLLAPQAIYAMGSSDGGQTFTPPRQISQSGGYRTNGTPSGNVGNRMPRVAVSQGQAGTTGGQLSFVWDDFASGTYQGNPNPYDVITFNQTQGLVLQQVSSAGVAGATGPITYATDPGNNAPHIPAVTTFPLQVNLNDPRFTNLEDLSVAVNLNYPALDALQIRLIPPVSSGLSPITLLRNRTNPNNSTNANVGATGANLGGSSVFGAVTSTVFDTKAYASFTNNGGGAASLGYFRPDGTGLASVAGLTAAQLSGTWTLEITSNRNPGGTPPPAATLNSWALNFSQGLNVSRNGNNVAPGQMLATTPVTGILNVAGQPQSGGQTASSATTNGIAAAPVIAVDNTLGSFSPYQGRIYIAYTTRAQTQNNPSDNTDIALLTSSDGGLTWVTQSAQVNDDNAQTDGSSESSYASGRPQFQPVDRRRSDDRHHGHELVRRPQRRGADARGDLRDDEHRRRPDLQPGCLRQHAAHAHRPGHQPDRQPGSDPGQRAAGAGHRRQRQQHARLRRSSGPGRLRRPHLPGLVEQPERRHRRQRRPRHPHGPSRDGRRPAGARRHERAHRRGAGDGHGPARLAGVQHRRAARRLHAAGLRHRRLDPDHRRHGLDARPVPDRRHRGRPLAAGPRPGGPERRRRRLVALRRRPRARRQRRPRAAVAGRPLRPPGRSDHLHRQPDPAPGQGRQRRPVAAGQAAGGHDHHAPGPRPGHAGSDRLPRRLPRRGRHEQLDPGHDQLHGRPERPGQDPHAPGLDGRGGLHGQLPRARQPGEPACPAGRHRRHRHPLPGHHHLDDHRHRPAGGRVDRQGHRPALPDPHLRQRPVHHPGQPVGQDGGAVRQQRQQRPRLRPPEPRRLDLVHGLRRQRRAVHQQRRGAVRGHVPARYAAVGSHGRCASQRHLAAPAQRPGGRGYRHPPGLVADDPDRPDRDHHGPARQRHGPERQRHDG